MIGDAFLDQMYHAFQELRTEARDGHAAMPYIQDYYNVNKFTQNQLSSNKSVPARIVNSVIDALNMHSTKMPRILLIIPDQDLLKNINYFRFGISQVVGNCLNWIVSNIVKVVDARKDTIWRKKPGTLVASEPKVIWVKMPNRPNGQSNLLAVRNKFNNILEDILSERKNHYIIDVNQALAQHSNFTSFNSLNDKGKEIFWLEVDRAIEKFDYNKKVLKPNASKPLMQSNQTFKKNK